MFALEDVPTAILVNVLIEGKPCLWVYGDDMGEMKDFQATLELKQGAVPKLFAQDLCLLL